MRFLGNSVARTDAKGRVFLSAAFRKLLHSAAEECLVMRKDTYQPCLVLYPEKAWNELMDQLRDRLDPWNPKHRMMFRQYVAEVGRYLRMAHIGQEVRFVGMDSTIEIWSSERADRPFISPEDFGRQLAEIMGKNTNGQA